MKSLWRIVSFTRELRRYYGGVAFFSILVAATTQVQPLLTKTIVDEVTKVLGGVDARISVVVLAVIGIFLADLAQNVFSNIGGVIGDQLQVRLRKTLSERYFQHLLELPQSYYDRELSGKVLNQLNRSIDQITTFAQAFSNNFLQFIFSTILSLGIIALYSWPVALMLGSLYPIFIWLTTRTSGKWRQYQATINQEADAATGRFAEAIGQIKVVKSFGQQAHELKQFTARYQRMVETTWPQSKLWHGQDFVRRLVLNVIFLAVYAYICLQAVSGNYSLGTMVLLLQYAALIRMPIFSISFIVDQSQRAVANTKDYFTAMDEPVERLHNRRHKKLKVTKGGVKFTDVIFGYEVKQPVLRGISFELKPGSKTALVGESGEGKTTVTNLLLGLYQAQGGTVTIDGQDVAQVTGASLRAASAVVFQEPALFSGTVYENISYARPEATAKEVQAAARAANAHEFIEKFEKGYDSEIGERGLKLSGGQKQRISIARALLKDAPILILDEATSSLDSKSEHLVQQALERLMKGRTTLIIAHRLSTIQSVDTIITLRGGTVEEQGSPAKLAKTKGIYSELLRLQNNGSTSVKTRLRRFEIVG
ncbi:ABC transporter ATP-binding protein [Candidatus Saccharibacteria bacterium]|nr:MAG: ABC transporter ATP-binding protein [Candidatus Saccharibacteria bacterium]